jgi:cytochrome bd-type quinol oxidase subunit 2
MAETRKTSWLRDNGLTLVLIALFLASIAGQLFSGLAFENEQRMKEGAAALSLPAYVGSGAFLSSVFENWESEFLQMWAYVMLTAYFYQRGSAESRDPDVDEAPRKGEEPGRKRSIGRIVYQHSLGLALLALFLVAFLMHWVNSARHAAEEAATKGLQAPGMLDYLGDPQLWFESFQNWQSEFLSTAVLVVLGIFLRERQSPESKAVDDSNAKTGAD